MTGETTRQERSLIIDAPYLPFDHLVLP